MIRKSELPACPVATTLNLIDSKWKIFILQKLIERPWRYNELRKSIAGVSQKVLTDSLRSMEADGIIRRKIFDEMPPRVEYSLTEIGESMKTVLDVLYDFGLFYQSVRKI